MDKREYDGPLINRNTQYWKDLYENIDMLYMNKTKLPKGTILYRCSTDENPYNIKTSNDVIYFGLDFVICTWFALEINEKSSEYVKCYLHIYELKKDVPYKYLYSLGGDGVPMELDPKTCIKKACIHPQEILHGNEYPYKANELGIEISFPKNKVNNNLIYSLDTYEINIEKLKKNKNKYIYQWNPKNALNHMKSIMK